MSILQKVTLQILKKNKTRTVVTVIGILLSAAMFTAVTTCVSSTQHFLYRTVIATVGDWHGAQYGVEADELKRLESNGEVRQITALERIGYAMAGSSNAYKPYLMVCGTDENLTEMLPVHLLEGRLPQNSSELLLPAHLSANGKVDHALGDTLTLELGERLIDGWSMDQSNPYTEEERFAPKETRTYTVVGFYRRPSFESYTAPGYTALTVSEGERGTADVYIQMKNPRKIYSLLDNSAHANTVNDDLLRYTGFSNEGSYNQVLFGLAAILMGIISFGSVSLIYNAFSISVGERTKQFGILKTIGATRRQLRSSVLFEAAVLSAIGIPLGVGSGILGIWITLLCTRGWFDSLFSDYAVSLELYVSLPSVALAVVICLITVLISAWIPAGRAIRRNAIESVRQNADIAIRPNKVRTPRWVYWLFGFEGMLADKNFKRNRKRYRATVASLFVSVVLFISTSSFCSYLTNAVDHVVYVGNYDLSYYLNASNAYQGDPEVFRRSLESLENVEEVIYYNTTYMTLQMEDEELTEEYRQLMAEPGEPIPEPEAYLTFLDDAAFRRWAEAQTGESADRFFEAPLGIAVDGVSAWDYERERYTSLRCLKDGEACYSFLYVPEELDGYLCVDSGSYEGGTYYVYQNEAGDRVQYYDYDKRLRHQGTIGAVAEQNPTGTEKERLEIVYPRSMLERLIPNATLGHSLVFELAAPQTALAEEEVERLLERIGLSTDYLNNMADGNESDLALLGVINVFSYGFIILISLIALANVFNTISTNVSLRRREFAMLRSVGMTEKGVNKMMNFECILYGVKGLGWGLLAAVGVTFLIYLTVNAGVATSFYLPWYSVLIAVASVFIVVFATMLYAMSKIKKEDPIEALKNENL